MKRSWVAGIACLAALPVISFFVWPRQETSTFNAAAQNFVLPKLTGSGSVQLSELRGKPVVVDLFASWCTACRDELPILAAEAKKLSGKVVFVGVDSEDTGDGLAMARQYGISDWPLASDIGGMQSDYHDQLGYQGMPVSAFYDAKGKLIATDGFALTQSQLIAKLHEYFHIN